MPINVVAEKSKTIVSCGFSATFSYFCTCNIGF